MQKELVTPITHLEVGESVYLPLPCFLKKAIGHSFMAAYDTTGTVTKVAMVEEGLQLYAEVFFPAIDGPQMLPRKALVRKADGSIVCCMCHSIDESNDSCDCEYTSVMK